MNAVAIKLAPALYGKVAMVSKSIMAASACCAVVNFAVWETLTDKSIFAVIASLLSAPACAYFAARPRVIAAEAAKAAAAISGDVQSRTLIDREYDAHLQRVHDDYARRLVRLEAKLSAEEEITDLVRASRHEVVNELNSLEGRELLWSNQITPPVRTKKLDVGKLFKEEDEIIAKIRSGKKRDDLK